MSDSRFDSRPGVRSNETIFLGRSPLPVCLRLVLLAALAGGVAAAFAASEEFRTRLRVEPGAAPWAAALSGGAATLLLVCALWMWSTRLRWVAVSADGIRWCRGPRARLRRWEQYLGIERGPIEMSVWGSELKVGQYADVTFHGGTSFRVSTHTVCGYEELIGEIQAAAAEALRALFPVGGSRFGQTDAGVEAYGPLRVRPDGVEWDGRRHRWDDIEGYELAVGYLRIKPANGDEFLRRVTELGDWGPVLARLEANVGFRQSRPG